MGVAGCRDGWARMGLQPAAAAPHAAPSDATHQLLLSDGGAHMCVKSHPVTHTLWLVFALMQFDKRSQARRRKVQGLRIQRHRPLRTAARVRPRRSRSALTPHESARFLHTAGWRNAPFATVCTLCHTLGQSHLPMLAAFSKPASHAAPAVQRKGPGCATRFLIQALMPGNPTRFLNSPSSNASCLCRN